MTFGARPEMCSPSTVNMDFITSSASSGSLVKMFRLPKAFGASRCFLISLSTKLCESFCLYSDTALGVKSCFAASSMYVSAASRPDSMAKSMPRTT